MCSSCFLIAVGVVLAAAPRGHADGNSHRAAAEEMLAEVGTEKAMSTAIDQMISAQVRADPRLEPVKEVMRKFFAKHLSYAAVKGELVRLYTAEFTEAELKDITAFYRTPTGKKAVEKLPGLMTKGSELGVRRVQQNAAELRRLIDEGLNAHAEQ